VIGMLHYITLKERLEIQEVKYKYVHVCNESLLISLSMIYSIL